MSEAAAGDGTEQRVTPPPLPMAEFTSVQLARRKELLREPVSQFRVAEHPGAADLADEAARSGGILGATHEILDFYTRYFPRDRQKILQSLYDHSRQNQYELIFTRGGTTAAG